MNVEQRQMEQHRKAFTNPRGVEMPIVQLFIGWQQYATVYQARYEQPIGRDRFIGDQWATIGRSLRRLLNGETGRLYCAKLDGEIVETLRRNGVEVE